MHKLKNMLIVALAMAFCLASPASAAYSDAEEIRSPHAVEALTALGIMGGEPDGEGAMQLRPRDTITRAEFCKMICVLMGGGSDPLEGDLSSVSFTDTKGHWASGYIEFTAGLGLVAGHGDGTFGPDDPITGLQAVKVLLAAMGYDALTEKLVGADWAKNTDRLAEKNGLWVGIEELDRAGELARDQAAQAVCNALSCPVRYYRTLGTSLYAAAALRDGYELTMFEYYYNETVLTGTALPAAGGARISGKLVSGFPESLLGCGVRAVCFNSGDGLLLIGKAEKLAGNVEYPASAPGIYNEARIGLSFASTPSSRGAVYAPGDVYVLLNGWQAAFVDSDGDGMVEFIREEKKPDAEESSFEGRLDAIQTLEGGGGNVSWYETAFVIGGRIYLLRDEGTYTDAGGRLWHDGSGLVQSGDDFGGKFVQAGALLRFGLDAEGYICSVSPAE